MQANSPDKTIQTDDLAVCQQLIQTGSRSFYTASLLLPARVRAPAYALYAFCRLSDDAVDVDGQCVDAADGLRERLERAYAGMPADNAADRAFAEMVARHDLPKALPLALLDGLAWDVRSRDYHTLSELYDYSARVAGSVGAMMTVLMGVRDADVLARACDLGVAMQLTNIARDVGEDARNGRIYLPSDWLEEAGVDRNRLLAEPAFTPELAAVIARLIGAADKLYDRSLGGICALPIDCRPSIHAARLIYREIGHQLASKGYDSIARRTVVSRERKIQLLAKACLKSVTAAADVFGPALDETAFLVDAVPYNPFAPRIRAWWQLEQPIGRLLELFEQLEQRERFNYAVEREEARGLE